jgi:hypothetical protein
MAKPAISKLYITLTVIQKVLVDKRGAFRLFKVIRQHERKRILNFNGSQIM